MTVSSLFDQLGELARMRWTHRRALGHVGPGRGGASGNGVEAGGAAQDGLPRGSDAEGGQHGRQLKRSWRTNGTEEASKLNCWSVEVRMRLRKWRRGRAR